MGMGAVSKNHTVAIVALLSSNFSDMNAPRDSSTICLSK